MLPAMAAKISASPAPRRGRPPAQPGDAMRPDARHRLLLAGFAEFARNGYDKASTRAIAGRAGANIALISYHFTDKAGLYRAVLNTTCAPMSAGFARLTDPKLDLAAGLRLCYAGFLDALRDPDEAAAHAIRIHFRECMDPSDVFRDWIAGAIQPMFDALMQVLQRHLRLARPDDDLRRLGFAIVALANDYWMSGPFIDVLAPKLRQKSNWVDATIERLTDYGCAMVVAERARRRKRARAR